MRYAAFYSKRQLKLAWWSLYSVHCTLYIVHCTLYIVQSSRWELYNAHRTSYSLAGGNCKVHRTAQPINFVFIVAASLLRLDCAIRVVASAPRRECCPQVARLVPPGGHQIGRITADPPNREIVPSLCPYACRLTSSPRSVGPANPLKP